jgi:light-harvesting complex 1 beta chain
MSDGNARTTPRLPPAESKGFYGIFVVSFIVFLLIALIAQTFALQWRAWFPGSEGDRSMIGGVKAAVYTFMSHLA